MTDIHPQPNRHAKLVFILIIGFLFIGFGSVDDTSAIGDDDLMPRVTSSTHPEPGGWYADNNPRFTWELPDDVTGVSWLLHENPDGNPGNSLDGLVEDVSFSDIPDGITYFHIKFSTADGFGPIAHYEVRTDSEPPLDFTVRRVDEEDATAPRPSLVYSTTDALSGIQGYRMRIDDEEWFDVPEASVSEPFLMTPQLPGEHVVVVEAFDGAGSTVSAELGVTIVSITIPSFSDYPERVGIGVPFHVSGAGGAGDAVNVYIGSVDGDERIVDSRSTTVGDDGRWSLEMPGLQRGEHDMSVEATDERGAISYRSDAVVILAGSPFMNVLLELPHIILTGPWWVFVLGIVLLELILWPFIFGRRRSKKKAKVVVPEGDLVRSGVDILMLDIELELATIKRLSQSRELHPEEKRLVTKLTEYLKSLKKIAAQGASRTGTVRRRRKK